MRAPENCHRRHVVDGQICYADCGLEHHRPRHRKAGHGPAWEDWLNRLRAGNHPEGRHRRPVLMVVGP